MSAPAVTRIRSVLDSTWAQVALLTLALGATVAISWLTVGGRLAATGPMPTLQEKPLQLFGFQALLAASVMFTFVRLTGERSWRRVAGLAVAAWLGELVVLTVGGSVLVANELIATVAWFYWLIGTGGPIQPIAAIVGGLIALRLQR